MDDIKRCYKNNRELMKELEPKRNCDYIFKVRCFSDQTFGNKVFTDLYIDILRDNDVVDTITYATLETVFDKENQNIDELWDLIERQRKELAPLKKKLFKYLNDRLENVEFAEDYTP